MDRSENKGLLATVLLLLGLFILGYYGQDYQSNDASELLKVEDSQLLINKDLEE
jgi:hypothetical protein